MKSLQTRIARILLAGVTGVTLLLQGYGLPVVTAEELPAGEPVITAEDNLHSPDAQTETPENESGDGESQSPDNGTDLPDPSPTAPNPAQPDEETADPPDTPDETSGMFSDIRGHWGREYIDFWLEQEMVSGYPDGTFRPDAPISRAEAAVLTSRIRKLTGETQATFIDVPEDHWAFSQIQACYTFDILKGTGDGLFLPEDSITREAAMTLLYRATDLSPDSSEDALSTVPDRDQVSGWAAEAVAGLLRERVVSGDESGLLHPGNPVTRAEFLAMLYRMEDAQIWDPSLQEKFAFLNPKWIVSAQNPDDDSSLSITVTASNLSQRTLILPSGVNPHKITLECTLPDPENTTILISGNRKLISGTTLDLTDLSYPDQENAYPLTVSISDGEIQRDYHYRVLYGTSLDSIFLSSDEDSGGRFHVEKEKGNSVDASMQMITHDGSILYNGELTQLKSRGNSTFVYPKKPYQIKLDTKTDLMGNGEKGKTWVLLANYADPTMLKDKLCKDLAADLQLPGVPDCKWVDLYFDGEYRGVYLLTEKIQISSTGLEITDLEEMYNEVNENYGEDPVPVTSRNKYGNEIQYTDNLNTPKNSKNGYLIELNHTQYDEINGFLTTRGKGVNLKAPEYLSQQDVKYISEFYQEFEDAVYAVNQRGRYTGINSRTRRSFTEYCDLDSMARMYLLYQFSLNADAYFGSTYFYMEDQILHQGPIWDSDLSFGIVWDGVYEPDHELQNSYLSEALERIPAFRKAVKKLYDNEFRDLELQYTDQNLNEYKEQLALSESRNHLIWPEYYQIAAFEVAYYRGISYDEVVSDLQQWMTDRIDYLDQKFESWNR